MKKITFLPVLLAMVMSFCIAGTVLAMDYTTTVHKKFLDFNYPNEEKMVGLEVVTKYEHQEGSRKSEEEVNALHLHKFLVNELSKHGWQEDNLLIDDVIAKKMELFVGYRTKVFVYQCKWPDFPYRGENYRVFFAVPIDKMEKCLTEQENLQN
ncbi:MAG: hypothetical protein ABIJ50_11630 [Pseudomonadota bacterium]